MTENQLRETMEGLLRTAREKQVVLGTVDAAQDIARIANLIEDLECFWDSDTDWSAKLKEAIE